MLTPLEQWYCDNCGEVIQSAREGYLEWLNDGKAHSFKIVHHAPASPRRPGGGDCYHYTRHRHRRDINLDSFVGPAGMARLLSFLDVGPIHDPDAEHSPQVQNMREFAELMRRLTIPYYEEALRYWSRADADDYFGGANEVWIYLPDTLRTLIERYGEEDED